MRRCAGIVRGSCAPCGDGHVDDAAVDRAFRRTWARSRPSERWLVATRDPENATPREAMMFAAYGVQINRCR